MEYLSNRDLGDESQASYWHAYELGIKAGWAWWGGEDSDYPENPYTTERLICSWQKGFDDGIRDAEVMGYL
jgi:hypothetical protein